MLDKGAAPVFEQYILSKDANLVPSPGSQDPPLLLSRYLGGFLHPLIHSGYGAEFGLLGMWAEGKSEVPLLACPNDLTHFERYRTCGGLRPTSKPTGSSTF